MSRLIVKNLPKNIKEEKLRKVFSEKGTITDIQLKYTPDGKFRQFGFIGYKTEEEAQKAIEYFNGSCINTTKISVELCSNLGDATKPKSWSKHASDSKKPEKISKNEKSELAEIIEAKKSDPLFEEYLSSKLNKGAIWANDLAPVDKDVSDKETEEVNDDNEKKEEEGKLADKEISDLEYMKSLIKKPRQKMEKMVRSKIELFTVKIHGLGYHCKKKELKQFFKPLKPYSMRIPRNAKGFAYVGFKTEKELKKALLKDKSFIGNKQISVFVYTKKDENENHENEKKFKNTPWKDKEELLKNEEDIAVSGKIFVRNLSYMTTEQDLQQLFEKYGPLTEVNLPVDKSTRQIKGFGTITFVFPEHAAKAYCELDGSVHSGRMLHLLPVKSTPEQTEQSPEEEGTNFKAQKQAKQKQQAGSSHNWNSLFIDPNAAANVIAKNFNTSKETLLGTDPDAITQTSAAVRLALGETQLVQSIKSYLESHDVHLDAFSSNAPRSKTVLLVKNLPDGATEVDIREKFIKFGPLSRVVMPPNGLTALVEYYEGTEAREAFRKLAYSKFGNKPLYLEWAPENVFSKEAKKPDENTETKSEIVEVEEEEVPEENTVLFVKNLNFKTSEEALTEHFSKIGRLKYATIASKKSPLGDKLSMGYGFVRYFLEANANEALKKLQFSELDGKSLEIKRSERSTKEDLVQKKRDVSKKAGKESSKLLVRNIPFQANKKEIMELFKPFGEIKALRLPQKVGGESHRGFVFVDYQTKADAKKAFTALSQSTHLYGRRLVLEWAENDVEDLAELRKRTADQIEQGQKSKKFRKSLMEVGDKEEKDEEI